MNVKAFITFLFIISALLPGKAQVTETSDSISHELQEIIVTAKQPATKLVGTTLVTSIQGTALANLGTALDVLAQLPMINVQHDNVEVVGKNNIEVYIDGRPMHDNMELQQLLSSNLKKIELLMSPGASYASTTGAVLRITTRRSFVQGLSFSDQLRLQKRRKFSIMDNIAVLYKTDNWDFFVDGTVNRANSMIKGITTNTLVYKREETLVGSSQNSSYPTTTGVFKASVNYSKDMQSLGAYYRYNPENGNFNNSGTEWLNSDNVLHRVINKNIHAHSHLYSVYYENTFADKYLLHFDGDVKHSITRNNVSTTYSEPSNRDIKSNDKRISTLWAAKLYLNFPLWNGDFTAGTQDSHTRTSLDFRMLDADVEEYIPSSLTDARQTSAALFASWARTFGKLSFTAGARYEFTNYEFELDGHRDEKLSHRDHTLTPDVSLGYTFNDNAQMSISYKMGTVKPPYSQLTGSLNYVGAHEIEGGNPSLQDERMHDLQLYGMWKDFMIQANMTRSKNTYAYVKEVYEAPNLQLLMHPINIDLSALSLYVVWSRPLRWWNPNITVGMYRQWLEIDNIRYNRPIFSYYFDNTFSLPCGWSLTANMNGSTKGDMHTNRFGTTWFTMDASVGKTLLNKSLNIRLTATDIFNTVNNDWTMHTYGIFVDKRQSYDRRGISLNIIYNFQPRKSSYKGSAAAEAEMNRL